jgi:hypothetical protein
MCGWFLDRGWRGVGYVAGLGMSCLSLTVLMMQPLGSVTLSNMIADVSPNNTLLFGQTSIAAFQMPMVSYQILIYSWSLLHAEGLGPSLSLG